MDLIITLVAAAAIVVIAMLLQPRARRVTAGEATTKHLTLGQGRNCEARHRLCNALDLSDYPEVLDMAKTETFFQECSEAFPQQKEICLPLGMSGRVFRSEPPLKAELQLRERLRRACHVMISTRILPPEKLQRYPFEYILFAF